MCRSRRIDAVEPSTRDRRHDRAEQISSRTTAGRPPASSIGVRCRLPSDAPSARGVRSVACEVGSTTRWPRHADPGVAPLRRSRGGSDGVATDDRGTSRGLIVARDDRRRFAGGEENRESANRRSQGAESSTHRAMLEKRKLRASICTGQELGCWRDRGADCGLRGLRTADCGLRAVVCDLWSVGCGLWAVVCGLWACGPAGSRACADREPCEPRAADRRRRRRAVVRRLRRRRAGWRIGSPPARWIDETTLERRAGRIEMTRLEKIDAARRPDRVAMNPAGPSGFGGAGARRNVRRRTPGRGGWVRQGDRSPRDPRATAPRPSITRQRRSPRSRSISGTTCAHRERHEGEVSRIGRGSHARARTGQDSASCPSARPAGAVRPLAAMLIEPPSICSERCRGPCRNALPDGSKGRGATGEHRLRPCTEAEEPFGMIRGELGRSQAELEPQSTARFSPMRVGCTSNPQHRRPRSKSRPRPRPRRQPASPDVSAYRLAALPTSERSKSNIVTDSDLTCLFHVELSCG